METHPVYWASFLITLTCPLLYILPAARHLGVSWKWRCISQVTFSLLSTGFLCSWLHQVPLGVCKVEVMISILQMYVRLLKVTLTYSRAQSQACSLLSPWVWLWCVHHHFILPGRATVFQWPWHRCLAWTNLHETPVTMNSTIMAQEATESATAKPSLKSKVLLAYFSVVGTRQKSIC